LLLYLIKVNIAVVGSDSFLLTVSLALIELGFAQDLNMSKNNFNGWTNQAALDINFHVHNDQVACSAKDELIRLQRRPISGLDVRRLVRDYLANVHRELLTSPKGSGNSIEDINWDEIACVWEAERRSNRSSSITQCL
jgi:hypothetical protein